MKALVTLFLAGLFLTTPALAQNDAADVEAALLEMYAQLNASDATYVSFWHPEATTYSRAGGLLGPARTEIAARAAFDAGLEYRVTIGSLDTRIFGGDVAIVTYYTGGLVRNPEGRDVQPGGSFRASMMWTKDGGEWKIVHLHISPL